MSDNKSIHLLLVKILEQILIGNFTTEFPQVTSGEEFIAVPRHQYGGACAGCSSHVNPQAPGVSDLAALAVRHLDRHEPNTKHSLQTVLDVERQVQVCVKYNYYRCLK